MSNKRGNTDVPGPGDYNVYASGIEDRIRPSCQSVGAVYHKPTARSERSLKIRDYEEAQRKELGPGCYNSSRGLSVVKPRSTMLVNIQSEAKPTVGLMTQSYWDQKASDLRETHDDDRQPNVDVISSRVQTATFAPPKNASIRSEKQLNLLIKKKIRDVEMRTQGNYYNAKYDSCSWVKQPLVTKQSAKEIARRVNRRRQLEKELRHEMIERLLSEAIEEDLKERSNSSSNNSRDANRENSSSGIGSDERTLAEGKEGRTEDLLGLYGDDEQKSDGYVSPTEELVGQLTSEVKTMRLSQNIATRASTRLNLTAPAGSKIHHTAPPNGKPPFATTKFEREMTASYLKSLKAKKKV